MRCLFALTLAAGAVLTPASSRSALADTSTPAYGGHFAFAGGEEERRSLEQAIEEATEPMNLFVRGVARDRLRGRLQIASAYDLAVDAAQIKIGNNAATITAPRDGTPITWTNSAGEELEVVHRLIGGKLEQRVGSESGGRTTVFTLTGDTLIVDVMVSSSRLPRPVEYRLTYRRS